MASALFELSSSFWAIVNNIGLMRDFQQPLLFSAAVVASSLVENGKRIWRCGGCLAPSVAQAKMA